MNINGLNIRKYREEQGYTQNDFAKECQISRAYYGRIERGEHSITVETSSWFISFIIIKYWQ